MSKYKWIIILSTIVFTGCGKSSDTSTDNGSAIVTECQNVNPLTGVCED